MTLVVIEVKEEEFNLYLQILSQGDDASPIISGLVRIQGGIMSQGGALETDETHLSVTRSQSDTGKFS